MIENITDSILEDESIGMKETSADYNNTHMGLYILALKILLSS